MPFFENISVTNEDAMPSPEARSNIESVNCEQSEAIQKSDIFTLFEYIFSKIASSVLSLFFNKRNFRKLKKFLNPYISLPEAHSIVYEITFEGERAADVLPLNKVGTTRSEFCHSQLMLFVRSKALSLYGYATLKGDAYKFELVPLKKIPDFNEKYKWDEDYDTITFNSEINEPIYTGVCIRNKDLKKAIRNLLTA